MSVIVGTISGNNLNDTENFGRTISGNGDGTVDGGDGHDLIFVGEGHDTIVDLDQAPGGDQLGLDGALSENLNSNDIFYRRWSSGHSEYPQLLFQSFGQK